MVAEFIQINVINVKLFESAAAKALWILSFLPVLLFCFFCFFTGSRNFKPHFDKTLGKNEI